MHDYVLGIIGGLLIGSAGAALLLVNGNILGVSGTLGGALDLRTPNSGWRWAFLSGMVVAGGVSVALSPEHFAIDLDRTLGMFLVAGLLMGVGTRLGSGCTSGHGVCGVGRLSKRSITATSVFTLTGALSVLLVRALFGGSV